MGTSPSFPDPLPDIYQLNTDLMAHFASYALTQTDWRDPKEATCAPRKSTRMLTSKAVLRVPDTEQGTLMAGADRGT